LLSFWLKYCWIWSSSLRFFLGKKEGGERLQKGHSWRLKQSFM
jgi:hypothetical protein